MLLAYWLLIPPFRGLGAAWATFIGFLFHCCLSYVVAQRLFKVRIEWGRIGLMLALSVGLTVAGAFLTGQTLTKIVLFIAVLMGLWFSGVIRPSEKEVLLGVLNKGVQRLGLSS